MLKDIKNILLLALFIIIAILLFKTGCNKPSPDLSPKIDSVTTHDTVWATDTLVKFKPVIKPKWDTVYQIDTLEYAGDPDDLFFTRIYNDSLVDTNQTIFYHVKTFGMLDSMAISYKLKIPIKINTTTTITNTNIVTKIPRFSSNLGISLIGNKNTFDMAPYINIHIKKNNVFYSYHILNKTHQIGVGITILKSKK